MHLLRLLKPANLALVSIALALLATGVRGAQTAGTRSVPRDVVAKLNSRGVKRPPGKLGLEALRPDQMVRGSVGRRTRGSGSCQSPRRD